MSADIRRVTDPDAAHSALLATAESARRVDELRAVLTRDDVHLLVAHAADEPVGAVIGYELPRLMRSGTGMLLYSIDVAPAHRRRGIGKALIRALRELARERGCDATWLLTNTSNEAAMRLYASAGMHRPNQDDAMWELSDRV